MDMFLKIATAISFSSEKVMAKGDNPNRKLQPNRLLAYWHLSLLRIQSARSSEEGCEHWANVLILPRLSAGDLHGEDTPAQQFTQLKRSTTRGAEVCGL